MYRNISGCHKDIKNFTKLKDGQDSLNMDSYRPINNLITLDKIIEEDIKIQMTNYFDSDNLLLDQHHRSRAGHGTETATAHIDQTVSENYNSNYITTIL